VDSHDIVVGLPRDSMPSLYRAADDNAVSGQKAFLWVTRLRLLALSVIAVAGALSVEFAPGPLLMVVAAAFILAVALEVALWVGKPERRWYDGRAAAESLKTLVWRYCVMGEPFSETLDDQAVDPLFLDRVGEVLQGLRSMSVTSADHELEAQIAPEMRRLRQSDLKDRSRAYDLGRVQDQQTWYALSSQRNVRRAKVWTVLLVLLELCGLVLVALEVSGVLEIELIGIIAVLGACVVAWMETRQFKQLSEAYFVASHELDTIRSEIKQQDGSSWAAFVDKAEEAISREHTLWRASRGHDRV
jgi:hypothetical protein